MKKIGFLLVVVLVMGSCNSLTDRHTESVIKSREKFRELVEEERKRNKKKMEEEFDKSRKDFEKSSNDLHSWGDSVFEVESRKLLESM